MFVPLAVGAVRMVKREEAGNDLVGLFQRLRIKKLTKTDWRWVLGSTLKKVPSAGYDDSFERKTSNCFNST